MPYIELRDYTNSGGQFTSGQKDGLIDAVNASIGEGLGGITEFRYEVHSGELDEADGLDYILVVDLGLTANRAERKKDIARQIALDLHPILGTDSFAVRLRLQNAAFVPFGKTGNPSA